MSVAVPEVPSMLFPANITDIVCHVIQSADRQVRTELQHGYIASENDYTSNLTGTIRRQINGAAHPGLQAQSFVLKPGVERKIGADACIIFANSSEFKVGIFEAKWPRLSTHTDSWDAVQTALGHSHFDSQLDRQSAWLAHFAVWEMFYLEHPFAQQPQGFPPYSSACFWHADVYVASGQRVRTERWRDRELLQLGPVHDIEAIAREICACRAGVAIAGSDYAGAVTQFPDTPTSALVIRFDDEGDPASGG
jgi:hypothetical protein